MARIVLISCVSKKKQVVSKTRDLYTSPLFKKNLTYAKSLNPDKIYILSAKYGLLGLDDKIAPYDLTLNSMSSKDIKNWADDVLRNLVKVSDVDSDEFIFLAGNNYRKFLLPHIKNYSIPMKGLGIGKQLRWLTQRIKHE